MTFLNVYRGNGRFEARPLDAVLSALEARRFPLIASFTAERVALIGRFAAALQNDARWRGSTPILALAFWLRKAAITRMATAFRTRAHPRSLATGRGLAFHLPPQNVDTLFLYSWAIAFLSGNVNIVRLPEQAPATMMAMLDPLIALLEAIGSGDLFVTYSRQDAHVNECLSAISDCRLVWGGDGKAALFHRYPVRIGGKSLMFADRYSHAIVSAKAIAALDDIGLDRLAKALHDDIRLFDQQACSSPHTIHVLDASADAWAAVHRLIERVDALAQASPMVDPSHGMAKFAESCALAASDRLTRVRRLSNETTVVELAPAESRGMNVGGGFLSLHPVDSVEQITETMTGRDQTLTHFGLDPQRLEELAKRAAARGVARIVPVGDALNFDIIWDGYDLVAELTRVVRVTPSGTDGGTA
jgi:hypothetical protein